jgi:hypothetical protein
MLNPLATPFVSRVPTQTPRLRPSVLNKRLRLIKLFPLCLRMRILKSTQCAAWRLCRKPFVKRLRQLEELQAYRKDVEDKIADLQARAAVLAQVAATMVHSISFVDPRPPPLNIFDGHTYWWIWKGIKIRLTGFSSSHFHMTFDFSRYSTNRYVEVAIP